MLTLTPERSAEHVHPLLYMHNQDMKFWSNGHAKSGAEDQDTCSQVVKLLPPARLKLALTEKHLGDIPEGLEGGEKVAHVGASKEVGFKLW